MELFVENFDMYKDIDKIDLSEILELNGDKKFPLLEKDHYYLYKTGRSDHILMGKGKVFPGVYNTKTGNFLKARIRGNGSNYRMWMITLIHEHKKITYDVDCHRVCALAFINNPNPSIKILVNHKDTVKENYCVDNLEWVTRRENSLSENIDRGIMRRRELALIQKFNGDLFLGESRINEIEFCQEEARKDLEALKKTFLGR